MCMDILFSHTTALEILRLPQMRDALASGSRDIHAVPSNAPSRQDLGEAKQRLPELAELTEPAHLLVDHASARTDNSFCSCHVWGSRHPFGSVVRLASGIYCASPEQLTLQLAPRMSDLELTVLISELFSYYALNGRRAELCQRNVPATDPKRLSDHLGMIGPAHGCGRVRKVFKLAPVGSASPQETRIALLLSLPARLGGHGLRIESMNRPMAVNAIETARRQNLRKPDILLASRSGSRHVAIEYDGAVHLTSSRQAIDAERTNELTAAGVPEYRLNKVLSTNFDYVEDLVKRIRHDLGEEASHISGEKAEEARLARRRLHDDLLAMDFGTLGLSFR